MSNKVLINSPKGQGREMRLIVTVLSDRNHPPISITVGITESLAVMLMNTPVRAVNLSIEGARHTAIDNARLLDFK